MQELIELLELDEKHKEALPYLIDVIKEVYVSKEKEQIINAYDNGSDVNDDLKPLYGTPEEYFKETYG